MPEHRTFAARVWLLAAGLLLAVSASAAELSPQERLEAVRQGLIQTALEGATQVQTTSWIDGDGVLRESSSFRSGMRVRGVRVLGYARDDAGQPRAKLQVQGTEDLVKASAAPADAKPKAKTAPVPSQVAAQASACTPNPRLRHLVGWSLDTRGRWSVDEAHLILDSVERLSLAWQQASDGASHWRLAGAPASHDAASAGVSTSAHYQRLLTAGPASLPSSWRARLLVEDLPSLEPNHLEPAREPGPRVRISLRVASVETGAPVFQAQAEVPLLMQAQRWAAPRLAAPSQALLQQLVAAWGQQLDARLACEPLKVQVVQAQAGRLWIDQGALAGIREGEEWLVSDRQKLPQRVLEPSGVDNIVLARVERVSARGAELKVLAGPAAEVQARWQAWPMQAP